MVAALALASVVPLVAAGVGRSAGAPGPPPTELVSVTHVSSGSDLPSQATYGWGSNDWGQLGVGSSGEGAPTPVATAGPVSTPAGVTFSTLAAGGAFTLGMTASGTVYSWGSNLVGELGVGAADESTTPQLITVPGPGVVAVAAGSAHGLALTALGQIYAWGSNLFGQLGTGTTVGSTTPVFVPTPYGVTFTAIAAGGDHSLALDSSGHVWAWGANGSGQLGDGTTASTSTPQMLPTPTGAGPFTAIATGTAHSLALDANGHVWAWGANASGQVGDGTNLDRSTPVPVPMPGGVGITSIATGADHSLALSTTGQVLVWGSNTFGQLGTQLVASLPVDSNVPVQPLGLPPLTAFVGVAGGIDSSYAVTSAGVAWVWGGDVYGQLGDGTEGLNAVPPETVATLVPGTLATGLYSGPDAASVFLVTRADQSVDFPALPSPTYGDPPVNVAPTTDSGLPLALNASGACTGGLARLFIVAAGTCTLTADQSGSFAYYPASATVTFTVAPAVLTVVPTDATGHLGQGLPPLGYTLSGFKDGDTDTVVAGQATCTTTATASLRGAYPITCGVGSLSAADYTIVAGPPGVLTVLAPESGYAVIGADGSIWNLGPQPAATGALTSFYGSMAGHHLNAAVVGASFTPRHDGYWMVATDGGIFSFGAAPFDGSMGGHHLNQPIVGMAATADGGGYWEVASDGGIFSFGDAHFYGSMGGTRLNRPIVGMAVTPDGGGYWMVASDGGIFSFGDAAYFGSTGGNAVGDPIVGMAVTPDGRGYWLTTTSGAVFSFGDAAFNGSLRYINLNAPVVGITPTADGGGYWLASADGGIFAFGDAGYFGRITLPAVPIDGII